MAGANEATTISFGSDVLIEGQKLPAGTYSFFTIPAESDWVIIFNKVANQWGAFFYNSEFDALRARVKPQAAEHQEWFNFGFDIVSATSAHMVLRWGKIRVPVEIEVEPAKSAGITK